MTSIDGGSDPLLPRLFKATATFSSNGGEGYSQGTRTETWFVQNGANSIRSDVFSLLPQEAQDLIPRQLIAGRTDDYADYFIRSLFLSDFRLYDTPLGLFGQTVTEMIFTSYDPSMGGTGSADRPFRLADVQDLLAVGSKTAFYSFDRVYLADGSSTRVTYLGEAQVTALSITGNVPEPATWMMMIAGVGLVGGALRRRTAKVSVTYA